MAGDFGPESLSLGDQPVQFFALTLEACGQFLWHLSQCSRNALSHLIWTLANGSYR